MSESGGATEQHRTNISDEETSISLPSPCLYLKTVQGKGRGVYAGENLVKGILLHISPVLIFPQQQKNSQKEEEAEKGIEVVRSQEEGDEEEKSDMQDKDGISISITSLKPKLSIEQEILSHYTYTWSSDSQALALGLGSMFNHSRYHNVGFILDKEREIIRYYTLREVHKDEELCINYGHHLWFEDVENYSAVETRLREEESDEEDDEKFIMKSFNFDEL